MAKYSGKGWHFQTERHSKAAKTGKAGGKYSIYNSDWRNPKNLFTDKIKGGLADGVNPKYLDQKELSKGIAVESEHTNNPKIAREIAEDHLIESKKYYDKLEKVEEKIEPIKIKITRKEVRRVKNNLEKDLQKAIELSNDPAQKKELEHLYRELRKADSHNAIKRYWSVYGNALETIAIAFPFQLIVPIEVAGIILGTGLTKEIDASQAVRSLAVPIAAFGISSEATKMSIRTYKAIKKREKQIINEKTIQLKKETNIPNKEIKEIAKRVARKELSQTKIVHTISEKPKI